MTIEVIKGVITDNGKDYGEGETLTVDDKQAERLIGLGYAKKSDGKKEEPAPQNSGSEGGKK